MLDHQQTIRIYEQVLALSTQMLEAANQGDWETMNQLQNHCSAQIEVLKNEGGAMSLSGPERDRKIELIQKILANDKAIRDIADPWLKELSNLLQNTDNQMKLARSYQNPNPY